MGRPRTEIGTYGKITFLALPDGRVEARARFRMRNGRLKLVSCRGKTEPAAERYLKKAMTKLSDEVAGKKINGATRMSHVMDLWLTDFADKVARGVRAGKSLQDYRGIIKSYLRSELGELTCAEAENAGLVDETLKDIRTRAGKVKGRGKNGDAAAKRARTVLSHVCGYAIRHGAMTTNPVKAAEAMDHEQEEIRALEPAERVDFLVKFCAEVDKRVHGKNQGDNGPNRLGLRARAWTDLPELVEGMLSTGLRIGEALALVGDDVDLKAREVSASHHLVREEGRGIVRKPKRKGGRAGVKPPITSWTESMWRRRKLASGGDRPLFPAWNGQWLDPGNVGKRINKVCVEIGYGWVSSRYFRHTTASHLGDSDLSNEAISDQLGNSPEIVQKHYRRRRRSNPAIAAALENLMDS
jgi:integrase